MIDKSGAQVTKMRGTVLHTQKIARTRTARTPPYDYYPTARFQAISTSVASTPLSSPRN